MELYSAPKHPAPERARPRPDPPILAGNPLAMAAGIKTLEILGRPGAYEHLDRVTSRLMDGLTAAAKVRGFGFGGSREGRETAAAFQVVWGLPSRLGRASTNEQLETRPCRSTPHPQESGHAFTGGHISGMFGFFFCDGPITCFEDAQGKADTAKFARFHR